VSDPMKVSGLGRPARIDLELVAGYLGALSGVPVVVFDWSSISAVKSVPLSGAMPVGGELVFPGARTEVSSATTPRRTMT